jgi:hypothetical protein
LLFGPFFQLWRIRCGKGFRGLEPSSQTIFIEVNPDDKLICGVYVGVDSGTRSTLTGVRSENKKDFVDFFMKRVPCSFTLGIVKVAISVDNFLARLPTYSCDSSDVT